MSSSTTNNDEKSSASSNEEPLLLVDAGTNLLDPMYNGTYRGKSHHSPDLHTQVLPRAWSNHIDKIIVLAGTITESKDALQLCHDNSKLFSTVGVHPTRCSQEFGTSMEELQNARDTLKQIANEGMKDGTVIAWGEFGLDYARTQFCSIEDQKRGLEVQLSLAKELNLPLYLHNRDTGSDLLDLLRDFQEQEKDGKELRGIVHSFDDTIELAQSFMELGLYIGINGCSLKTEENLEVVKSIPMDRILLETDCPWCDIRASHAGSKFVSSTFPTKREKQYEEGSCVKNRYEPCHVVQVAEVVAGVKGLSLKEVAFVSRKNAYDLFGGLKKKIEEEEGS